MDLLNIKFTSRRRADGVTTYRCIIRDWDDDHPGWWSGWDENPVRAFQKAVAKHPRKDLFWVTPADPAGFE